MDYSRLGGRSLFVDLPRSQTDTGQYVQYPPVVGEYATGHASLLSGQPSGSSNGQQFVERLVSSVVESSVEPAAAGRTRPGTAGKTGYGSEQDVGVASGVHRSVNERNCVDVPVSVQPLMYATQEEGKGGFVKPYVGFFMKFVFCSLLLNFFSG